MNKSASEEELPTNLPIDVLVVEDVWGDAFDLSKEQLNFAYHPDLWNLQDDLKEALKTAKALVVRNRTSVSRELLASAPMLKIVARAGVGLDNIDIIAADDLGIVVVAALGANATSVGEHAVATAFAFARDIVNQDNETKEGSWDRRLGFELSGRSWGVIGLGATGRETARISHAIGMKVYGYDPMIAEERVIEGVDVRVNSIDELLGECDIVSLHVPLTPSTANMVDASFLSKMRKGSYIINSSRGGLVDEDALLQALNNGHLGGAGLDVRVSEPPKPHPLNNHEKVIVAPHVAGLTYESQSRITNILASEIELVLSGEKATYNVGIHKLPDR